MLVNSFDRLMDFDSDDAPPRSLVFVLVSVSEAESEKDAENSIDAVVVKVRDSVADTDALGERLSVLEKEPDISLVSVVVAVSCIERDRDSVSVVVEVEVAVFDTDSLFDTVDVISLVGVLVKLSDEDSLSVTVSERL